jgi:mediator of RNA polymerase II transcription subunit 31
MSAPVDRGAALLDGFAVDVSHQELERVLVELEALYASQPGEWLPVAGVAAYLAAELGYEDADEFEDALKSDFKSFLAKLPHVVLDVVESELAPGTFREVFKVASAPSPRADPPAAARVLRCTIASSRDLWRVLTKSAAATLEIPAIEFVVGADATRAVDSVYNHVARCAFNLESHVRAMPARDADDDASDRAAIERAIVALRALLDVETPWTLVVRDVDGACAFKPDDGVVVHPA